MDKLPSYEESTLEYEVPIFSLKDSFFKCRVCFGNHFKKEECKDYCFKCGNIHYLPRLDCEKKYKNFKCKECNIYFKVKNNKFITLECENCGKIEDVRNYPFCVGGDKYNECYKIGQHVCPFKCPKCNYIVGDKSITIEEHIRKCKLKCKECGKKCKDIPSFNSHPCPKNTIYCDRCKLKVLAKYFKNHNCVV